MFSKVVDRRTGQPAGEGLIITKVESSSEAIAYLYELRHPERNVSEVSSYLGSELDEGVGIVSFRYSDNKIIRLYFDLTEPDEILQYIFIRDYKTISTIFIAGNNPFICGLIAVPSEGVAIRR